VLLIRKKGPLYNKDTPCGAADVVKDGITGFLAPVGDVNDLAAKIVTLLAEPRLMKSVGMHMNMSLGILGFRE